MFNLMIPGEQCASVVWTGKSVSINARNMIGQKWKGKKKISIIIKAPKYRDFCDSIIALFMSQWGKNAIEHGVFMAYYIGPHHWRGKEKDADAFHKPIQDGLEHAGIITNDKNILSYAMIPLSPNESMDFVRVELYRMDGIDDLSVIARKEKYEDRNH